MKLPRYHHALPFVARHAFIIICMALTACGGGGSTSSAPTAPATYNISGSVTGSPGAGLVLQLNGGSSTPINSQGFAWSNALTNGQAYAVTVSTQPAGQSCTVSNGSGTIAGADVTNVAVNCVVVPSLAVFAGSMNGPGNLNGPAANARFNAPDGIGTDSAGNIYVADYGNQAIRKITPAGVVSTITTASIALPFASDYIAADGSGNIFFSEISNSYSCISGGSSGNIEKVNSSGTIAPVTNAACLDGPLAVDSAGNLYVLKSGLNVSNLGNITKIPAGGSLAPVVVYSGGSILNMYLITVDSAGNIYVAGGGLIQKLVPGGMFVTLAGTAGTTVSVDGTGTAATFANLAAITVDGNGTLYALDGQTVRKITPTGVVTTLAGTAGVTGSADGTGAAASFGAPVSIAVDNQGNILVGDAGYNNIRKITAAGVVTTVAGGSVAPVVGSQDGLGSNASFNSPQGVATDGLGNVYVADNGNLTIRKITAGGLTSTFAGSPGVAGSANGTGAAARFGSVGIFPYNMYNSGPMGLATDNAGNVYVADPGTLNIREISPAGVVTTFAGPGAIGNLGSAIFYVYPYGYLFACDGFLGSCPVTYGPAVGPFGVAVNSVGNIYVAELAANTMSTITPSGTVTTLGGAISPNSPGFDGGLTQPGAVAADNAGNAYLTSGVLNLIYKVSPGGLVTVFAGSGSRGSADGVGTAAAFNNPSGITIDASGNLYVADSGNCTIRKITPVAMVSTVVGVAGQCGFAAGPLPAFLSPPTNVALSGRTLYITSANGVAVVNDVP